MSSSTYKYVVLGKGRKADYAARELAARGIASNELCLVGEEFAPFNETRGGGSSRETLSIILYFTRMKALASKNKLRNGTMP